MTATERLYDSKEGPVDASPEDRAWSRAWRFCRARPYTTLLLVAATLVGAVAGAMIPIGELSLLRRTLGGAVAGLYFGLFPLGYRLFE